MKEHIERTIDELLDFYDVGTVSYNPRNRKHLVNELTKLLTPKDTGELRKEFEEKFGLSNSELIQLDSSETYFWEKEEIWNFFAPHLSHDEIKREALNDFHEKFWKWGISHMPTMYFNHVCNFLNDYIDETLTQQSSERIK